jgi:transposase
MELPHIIGADISKKSIDIASHLFKTDLKIENNSSGFRGLVKWIKQQKLSLSEVMIVMEHTGLYSYQFEQFLFQSSIRFAKVSALEIKQSMGMVRGKSDKQDARRIARYGFEKASRLVAAVPADPSLQRLQMLNSTRERLVKNRAGLINAVKMYHETCHLASTDLVIQSQSALIKSFDRQIEKINEEMQNIIEAQKAIAGNYHLLQSVRGVGQVLALTTIIKTRNFTCFTKAKKFACFSGTAPFEKTSGSSIRGKTKVSKLADKRMKTLLDLAAKSAIQYDKELREYYLKRIQNGKSKMSTINVVRNKILYRMFAVIKRQTPFVENYLQTA